VLIVIVLALTTARTVFEVQDRAKPDGALEVTSIGRQWWWEFRYPQLGIVTAVSPDKAGAADVSFVAGVVPMIIDAVGLKGHDDHSEKETADLTTLPVQAKRAAVTLMRLVK
jgi:heme/copper-type cytochrome/quinol oxidase subunit 2